MNKVIAILIFALVAVSASAQFVGPNGEWSANWPVQIGTTYNPTPAMCEAAGWREASAQEIADKAAADQAAAEEAAAQAALPQVFPNGIATTDADGHHIEHVVTGSNQPILGVQVSNSPLTQEQREELKAAAMAERLARKSARKNAESEMFAAKNFGAFAPAFSNAWSALLDEIGLGGEE